MLPIIPVLKSAVVAAALFTHPAHVPPPAAPPAVVAATVQHAQQAPATYTVRSGDTLSGIAAAHHLAWPRLWAGNRIVIGPDPDVIEPGQVLRIAHLPAYAASPGSPASSSPPGPGNLSATQEMPSTRQFGGYASVSGSGPVTPGSSYEACVIARESSGQSQVMNSSSHYGLYQFDLATWESGGGSAASFGHASPAEQQQVFRAVYAARGSSPWTPSDGCPP